MTFAAALWLIAAVLIALAMAAMAYLVIARLIRDRLSVRDERTTASFRTFLIGLVAGSAAAPAELARLAANPGATANVLLEIGNLIRGGDRDRLFATLEHGGVFDALKTHAVTRRARSRLVCIEAIALFPGDAASDALRLASRHDDLAIRIAASEGLVTRGVAVSLDDLIANLSHSNGGVSQRGREVIRRIVRDDPQASVRALDRPDLNLMIKGVLLEALGASGGYELTYDLALWAQHPQAELRAQAVSAVGALRHPAAETIIAGVLADPEPIVRRCAARAIAQCGFKDQVEALLPGLNDPHWSVRLETARALFVVGGAGPERLREAAQTNPDPTVRHLAEATIAELTPP